MKCSVVTVCLNAERYLEQALDSVARQSWPDLEHLVIDGGSGDGTLPLVEAAAARDPRLRWVSGADRGISDAMNKGIALASGEIVAFLHADDFYPDRMVLRRVAEAFQAQPDLEWLTGGIHYVDRDGLLLRSYSPRRWSYRRLVRGNIIFHPATFVRRRVLEELGGFDTSLSYSMDYDLWLRLGRRSSPLLLERPLASFRLHPESTSVRGLDDAFAEELQVRLRHLEGKPLQQGAHRCYYWLKRLPNRMSLRGMR